MAVGDAYVFPGFLIPVLTHLFFPKPPTTFPTCFCRGERRRYAGKKSLLNRGSNSQPPGHESDTLTTEPPRREAFADNKINLNEKLETCFGKDRKHCVKRRKCWSPVFSPFPTMLSKAFSFRVVKSQDCVVKGEGSIIIKQIRASTLAQ